jgi:hypothetical protein
VRGVKGSKGGRESGKSGERGGEEWKAVKEEKIVNFGDYNQILRSAVDR